jgi:hypothetical protein
VISGTSSVALARDFFTDYTQTEQVATTVHEALHIQLRMGDRDLQGLLMNWGFVANNSGSHAITDWIASDCGGKD